MTPEDAVKVVKDSMETTSLNEMTDSQLREQIAQLHHRKEILIERLTEVCPGPGRLVAKDSFAWSNIQNHKGHELTIREADTDIQIYCENCNSVIATVESA